MRKINNIVIHCTATSQDTSIQSITEFWKFVKGWKSPGYHYIIDKNGVTTQLLEEKFVSNGVAGHNSDAIHIAYIGGIDKNGNAVDNRTLMQKAALIGMIKTLRHKYPNTTVLGHRDFSQDKNGNGIIDPWERIKECPCFDAKLAYNHI